MNLQRLLEKKDFQVVVGKEISSNNYKAHVAILQSSSIVFYKSDGGFLISVFPCDVKDARRLEGKVKSLIAEVENLIKSSRCKHDLIPKVSSGMFFSIGKVNYNEHFLGKGNKFVGYCGTLTTLPLTYEAYDVVIYGNERELLKSKNVDCLLEKLKSVVRDNFSIEVEFLMKTFGKEEGYSLILYNFDKFFIVTVHTWPESGNLHLEIFSKKKERSNLLKKLFKNCQIVTSLFYSSIGLQHSSNLKFY